MNVIQSLEPGRRNVVEGKEERNSSPVKNTSLLLCVMCLREAVAHLDLAILVFPTCSDFHPDLPLLLLVRNKTSKASHIAKLTSML